jgi:hypothetical protein
MNDFTFDDQPIGIVDLGLQMRELVAKDAHLECLAVVGCQPHPCTACPIEPHPRWSLKRRSAA